MGRETYRFKIKTLMIKTCLLYRIPVAITYKRQVLFCCVIEHLY